MSRAGCRTESAGCDRGIQDGHTTRSCRWRWLLRDGKFVSQAKEVRPSIGSLCGRPAAGRGRFLPGVRFSRGLSGKGDESRSRGSAAQGRPAEGARVGRLRLRSTFFRLLHRKFCTLKSNLAVGSVAEWFVDRTTAATEREGGLAGEVI